MEAVRVGGGGGSLTSAMHGGGGSGGRLGGGQVEVVHSAGGGVQHGGVVAGLWAVTLTTHLHDARPDKLLLSMLKRHALKLKRVWIIVRTQSTH